MQLRNKIDNKIDLVKESPIFKPIVIHIELTNKCNFKCVYCPESFDNYEKISGGYFFLTSEKFIHICNKINSFKIGGGVNIYQLL